MDTIFGGESTLWHGYDRYDFLMDEKTYVITQIKAAADETCETNNQVNHFHVTAGTKRCIVVAPKSILPGTPWSWRGYYFGHETQTEVALLKSGFHVCYIAGDADDTWDAWYTFLAHECGLNSKPAFIGMSRGGRNSYTWATSNPDKVSCIYADNPVITDEALMKLDKLADNDVPLLNICGSIDPILGNTLAIEGIYQSLGGQISVMIQEGRAHHPHSLQDPSPIVEFISANVGKTPSAVPAFIAGDIVRSHIYNNEEHYRYVPAEKTYLTLRGPLYTRAYCRYEFRHLGSRVTLIEPQNSAPGMPWVLRADHVTRTAAVDFALLEKGFYIVTGPVPTNDDGPIIEEWDLLYRFFVDHGFSDKPVMEGCGAAAGEAYAWAIENPNRVSCIYGENPVLSSNLANIQPIDNLGPLSIAGVHILHVCGEFDPWLENNTRVAAERYQKLGGDMLVVIKEGVGHYPLSPDEVAPVVEFVLSAVDNSRAH